MNAMVLLKQLKYLPSIEKIGCKKLSKNDISWAHEGGSKQVGILIPKIFVEEQLFSIDPNTPITDPWHISNDIQITWFDTDGMKIVTNSKFFHYVKKKEYRITHLNKIKQIFSNLSMKEVNFVVFGKLVKINQTLKNPTLKNWMKLENAQKGAEIQKLSIYYAEIISPADSSYTEFTTTWNREIQSEKGFLLSLNLITF